MGVLDHAWPIKVKFLTKNIMMILTMQNGLTWQKSSYERRKNMSLFKGKTLMITGGTGSFGNAVLNRFLQTDIGEIRIFSRDEKKQDDMRHEYQVKMPEVADNFKIFL